MQYAIELSIEPSRTLPSRRVWGILAFAAAMTAVAFGITIDTRTAPYNTAGLDVTGVGVTDEVSVRTWADTRVAAIYRLSHGLDTLPKGSTFTIIYHDGSGERVGVTSTMTSMGAVPEANSQFSGDCDLSPCPPPAPGMAR